MSTLDSSWPGDLHPQVSPRYFSNLVQLLTDSEVQIRGLIQSHIYGAHNFLPINSPIEETNICLLSPHHKPSGRVIRLVVWPTGVLSESTVNPFARSQVFEITKVQTVLLTKQTNIHGGE